MSRAPVYLDHAATTPLRTEVREAMEPFLSEHFGNPSSIHRWGRRAASALEEARERVARSLGAEPSEIVFVRGGTEGDNLAVLGRARWALRATGSARLAVSAVEHRAVLDAAAEAEKEGAEVTRISVDPRGRLDPGVLDRVLAEDPALISVMWVNNETGTLLPVEEVVARTGRRGIPVHVDAVQALGKVPVRVDEVPVDLLTISGHKIHGPKGIGALFIRKGTDLVPAHFGGGQERGIRPGTEDVAAAVGLARSVELAVEERKEAAPRLRSLRDDLEERLTSGVPELRVHGSEGPRAPHILNAGIPGIDSEGLVVGMDLEGVAVSSGSACSSGTSRESHVLRALYGEDEMRETASLRFSLGRSTRDEEVARAAEATLTVTERLRNLVGLT